MASEPPVDVIVTGIRNYPGQSDGGGEWGGGYDTNTRTPFEPEAPPDIYGSGEPCRQLFDRFGHSRKSGDHDHRQDRVWAD